jgi:hypothetical protein
LFRVPGEGAVAEAEVEGHACGRVVLVFAWIGMVFVDLRISVAGRVRSFTLAENVLDVARVQVLVGVHS